MGPRYDLGSGVLHLGLVTLLVVLFGIHAFTHSVLSTAFAVVFALAGCLSLVASRRPRFRAFRHRVDYLTLRGLSMLCVGVGMVAAGGLLFFDGEWFGLLVIFSGVFILLLGLGTILRRPDLVGGLAG